MAETVEYERLEHPYYPERAAIASTAFVREWVGKYRYMAWAEQAYECADCGWHSQVQLCAGVEGPAVLRELSCFVPSPFGIECPSCRMTATHVHWNRDFDYGELRDVHGAIPFFVVGDGQ